MTGSFIKVVQDAIENMSPNYDYKKANEVVSRATIRSAEYFEKMKREESQKSD